jgi:hypothetical protein
MTRLILAAALLVAPALSAHAPQQSSDREAVHRAAMDYIEGFYEGDSTKLMRSVRPDVFKYGYFVPRDSTRYKGQQMTWPEFLAFARNVKKSGRVRPATDPKEVQIYEVLDQTASVKVTAYWGIDYLLLARHDGKWMISHVLWQSPPRRA